MSQTDSSILAQAPESDPDYVPPATPDPNTFGYPTAEEAIETRKNFSRNIIIAISVIILIMLAIITFFSYRYRKVIKKIYDESKEKLAKKMKGNFID